MNKDYNSDFVEEQDNDKGIISCNRCDKRSSSTSPSSINIKEEVNGTKSWHFLCMGKFLLFVAVIPLIIYLIPFLGVVEGAKVKVKSDLAVNNTPMTNERSNPNAAPVAEISTQQPSKSIKNEFEQDRARNYLPSLGNINRTTDENNDLIVPPIEQGIGLLSPRKNEDDYESQQMRSISPSIKSNNANSIIRSYHAVIPTQQKSSTFQPFHNNRMKHDDVIFFVMGDVPYTPEEEINLVADVARVNSSNATFMVHVGDTQSKGSCKMRDFRYTSSIIFGSSIPTLVVPGDNDVIDCPKEVPPRVALKRFRKIFINDTSIMNSELSGSFQRQTERLENFAFWKNEVLFIGLNMLGEKDPEWEKRYHQNLNWFQSHFKTYESEARAVVIFAHCIAASPVYRNIKVILRKTGIPVLYIHGNGHVFKLLSSRDKFVRIQVDQGSIASPLQITISGRPENLTLPRYEHSIEESNNRVYSFFSGLVKIDRGRVRDYEA